MTKTMSVSTCAVSVGAEGALTRLRRAATNPWKAATESTGLFDRGARRQRIRVWSARSPCGKEAELNHACTSTTAPCSGALRTC
jgi:hypothetical protein